MFCLWEDDLEPESILKSIKGGASYVLDEDVDILGDINYQEFLFYSLKQNKFYRQMLDWILFASSGWKKSITYEEVDEEEALILIRLKLEQDNDE